MEHFEQLGITSAPVRPRIWYRYVDDTFVKINRDAVESFTHYINNIDDNIKLTWDPEKKKRKLSAPISGYLDHQET